VQAGRAEPGFVACPACSKRAIRLEMASLPPLLPREAPPHLRAWRFVRRIVLGLHKHNAAGAAPAMAFHFFLSLVPVLVLVGFVLGHVVRQRGVDAILGPAIEATPDAAEQIVRAELQRLAGAAASSLAPLSALVFVWLAAGGVHGLMDELEVIAQAPPRSWWHQRTLAHAWVLGALLAVAVVAWGMLRVDTAAHQRRAAAAASGADEVASAAPSASTARRDHDRDRSTAHAGDVAPAPAHRPHPRIPILQDEWEKDAVVIVLGLFGLVGLAAFYRLAVAHPPGIRRRVWPGALVAFGAWLGVSWFFGAYVGSLGRYTLYYGSVAAVAVLLVWLYLTSWSILIGAELNAQVEGLRDGPPAGPASRARKAKPTGARVIHPRPPPTAGV
jgi:membrane protein